MYTVEKILKANNVKTQVINTPDGLVVMADNEDGTYKMFNINVLQAVKKISSY